MKATFKQRLAEARLQLRTVFGALAYSTLGQAVSSLTSLGISLYLVRTVEKQEFGLYGLGFAFIMVIAGLSTSAFSIQYVVNVPDQPARQRGTYAAHFVTAVGLTGLALVGLACLVPPLVGSQLLPEGDVSGLAFPIAVATLFFSVRDLLIRVAFSDRRESLVFWNSLALASGVAMGFAALAAMGVQVNAAIAVLVYAAGQAVGCLHASIGLRLPWRAISRPGLRGAFRDAWRGGRWSILTSATYNARAQAHNFLVPPVLGIAALADVNAARILVTPAILGIPPVTQVLAPALASRRARPRNALRLAAIAGVALFGLALLYTAALLLVYPLAIDRVLGSEYAGTAMILPAWSVVVVLLSLRVVASLTAESFRAFKLVFVCNLAGLATFLALILPLMRVLGASGAVVALGGGEFVLLALLMWGIGSMVRPLPEGEAGATP